MRDMYSNKQVVHLGTLSLSNGSTVTSDYVDVRGFDACTIVVTSNTITDAGTASGFTFTLQESADTAGASAATVAAGDEVNGTVAITETSDSADNDVLGGFGYRGAARYVGVTVTGTTGSSGALNVLAVLNKPHRAATTFIGTAVPRT